MKTAKKLIPAIVIIILVLGGIGGGLFYLSYVESISIQNGQNGVIELDISDQELLIVNFPDKVYLNKGCTFTSSDTKVATVDSNGKIVAVGVGESIVTATSKWFDRTSSVKVVVSYGKPDTVKVETVSNFKQYSDQAAEPIVFLAKSYRNGFESQDPEHLQFRWVIKVDGVVKEDTVTADNTYTYMPENNNAQKIEATCTLVYQGTELTGVSAKDSAFARIFDKLTQQDIELQITSNLIQGKAELGKKLEINLNFLSDNVDKTLTADWSVAFNNGAYEELDKGNTLSYTPKNNGTYTFKASITEEGNSITKTVTVETVYQQVTSVYFVNDSLVTLPDKLEPFTATVKWNEYAADNQTVSYTLSGKDVNGENASYSLDVESAGHSTLTVEPIFNQLNNYVGFAINGTDTGIILKLDKLYTVKIYAKIGNVASSNYFSFSISNGDVKNIKIVATTDEILDNAENESILSKNNYRQQIKVGAVFYPLLTVTDVDWYVNNVKTDSGNYLKIPSGGDIGEYHIYCASKDGQIVSNTISIPSVNKNLPNDLLNYMGTVNGRTVNKYVTCQSDIDALLEYSILNTSAGSSVTVSNVYLDTIMQDLWAGQGENGVYDGECFWIKDNNAIYRVNSGGVPTVKITDSTYESISRAFYRTAYSGNFSGNILTRHSLNSLTSLRFETLPTDVPTKVSAQPVLQQRREQGFSYTSEPPYSKIQGVNVRHFPIDDIAQTITVSTSSELYDAVENGYRPICVTGSMADKIYTEAREILTEYVTDDMSDLEKAELIYQWIIWTCTYDYSAADMTDLQVNEALKYSAYYLEGVFAIENTIFSNQIAVCDGRSKAYVLMCAIEGIPCIRVTGMCYSRTDNSLLAGHAWNKVYISTAEGQPRHWYVVDTTWGDRLGGNSKYELYEDDMFLITDKFHNTQASSSMYCVEDPSVKAVPAADTVYIRDRAALNAFYTDDGDASDYIAA